MSQTFPGSYSNLFSQSLLKAIMQMSFTNPRTILVRSQMINMLDVSLAQSVLSVDGMLASVGVSTGTGAPQPRVLGNFGIFA